MLSLYPGYVLVETQDLDQADVGLFLDEEARSNDPTALTWVHADFDGNGVVDHAVRLRTPDGLLPAYQILAILLGQPDGHYEVADEFSYRGFTDYVILRQVDAGTTVIGFTSIDGPFLQIPLEHPAVEIVHIGKAAVVYYWDPSTNRLESIQTSE